MHIEERAQEILKGLAQLSGDFDRFRSDFELVGKHLTNMRSKYDDADKRLEKFDDRLKTMSGAERSASLQEDKKLPM